MCESHLDLPDHARTLGGVADGRVQTTARSSSLDEYPLDARSRRVTGISRATDKHLWLVEAHLETK